MSTTANEVTDEDEHELPYDMYTKPEADKLHRKEEEGTIQENKNITKSKESKDDLVITDLVIIANKNT